MVYVLNYKTIWKFSRCKTAYFDVILQEANMFTGNYQVLINFTRINTLKM